jgi:hypothetical protein
MGAHQRPLLPRLRKMRSEINYFASVPIPEVRPITFIWSGQYGDGVVNRLDDSPPGTRKRKYFRTKSKCAASFEQSCYGWQKEGARRPFACNVRPGCLFGFPSVRRHGLAPPASPRRSPPAWPCMSSVSAVAGVGGHMGAIRSSSTTYRLLIYSAWASGWRRPSSTDHKLAWAKSRRDLNE